MRKTYTIRRNTDGTITIRVGRFREYISLEGKSKSQVFDAVKYALISKEAFVSDIRLTEDLYEIVWQL